VTKVTDKATKLICKEREIIKENSPTRSVERALEILECFLKKDELILLEIAEQTNLSPSTVLRIISTLEDKNFVKRDIKTKKYSLGSKIYQLAEMASNNTYAMLKKVAYKHMLELSNKYNENVRLFVPDGVSKLCIEAVESTRELRQVIKVGERHDLVHGAAGKILLAFMSADERSRLFHEDPYDEKVYEKVREAGYALSIGEREEGLVGIAAPIIDEPRKLIAALSLSGPAIRFVNEDMTDKINDTIKTAAAITAEISSMTH